MQYRHNATLALLLVLARTAPLKAADYHVATDGDDGNPGSADEPWKTVQKAATTMNAGDSVTVHAGTYREWIDPPRGGTSNDARITYQAAEGEDVYLKGSEQITTWEKSGSAWTAVVPNTTFGSFNPYSATFTGDYLTSGQTYHLGEVYLNGTPYTEVLTQGEAEAAEGKWYAAVDGTNTTLVANFGDADPNAELTEINVRKSVIFPTKSGLDYLSFKGFHILQGAPNWAPPTAYPQEGLIAANFGFNWVIENNRISDGKAVCFSGGLGSGNDSYDIDKAGNHTIRHNTIERCGQAGIAGSHGMVNSLIEGNLIQDIHTPNYMFAGFECAGIKIHSAVDVVIEHNIIRQVGAGAYGIWLDWQSQGSRITGNVFYNLNADIITLEANHGPTLIDNNFILGGGIGDSSEATIFAHNLSMGLLSFGLADSRTPYYFDPHTTHEVSQVAHASADNKYFNNIFVSYGSSTIPEQPGFASDYNVHYNDASMTPWGDTHSVTSAFDAAVTTNSLPSGVEITFKADSGPNDIQCPLITRDFVGVASLTGQGIEYHDGSGITIDQDILGNARDATHPTAGPLETLDTDNTVTIMAGADLTGSAGSSGSGMGGSGNNTSTGGTGAGGNGNGGTGRGGRGQGGNAQGGTDVPEAGQGTGADGGTTAAGGDDSGGTQSTGGSGAVGSPNGGSNTTGGNGSGGKGASSSGGTSSAGAAGSKPAAAKSSDEDSGCGCSVPQQRGSLPSVLLSLLGVAAAVVRRRRTAGA